MGVALNGGSAVRTCSAAAIAFAAGWLLSGGDPNDRPRLGDTGLPKNCRAIVQANVDAYRAKTYPPDAIMASLERNCGAGGYSWGR
ncbi:hypothetical protein [Aquincola sp. J276]|uniref:hypothetical protein n=1 Tax=Aquincola sp. J276 TaxID=2898432 RepID=UPI00215120E8|nr:hypothetical protein [Aquincola sp. J276]MCR5865217.1 hypothetical protein [Aquincola sp. J276]